MKVFYWCNVKNRECYFFKCNSKLSRWCINQVLEEWLLKKKKQFIRAYSVYKTKMLGRNIIIFKISNLNLKNIFFKFPFLYFKQAMSMKNIVI